jgi:hypothetical protein
MSDERDFSKSELKKIFTNLSNKEITDVMMSVLIDRCYNEKTNLRSSGFNYPGGTDSLITWEDGTRTFTITPFDPEVADWKPRYGIWSWAGSAVLHRRYETETIELPDEEGLFCIYFDKGEDIRYQVLQYIKNPTTAQLKQLYTEKVIVSFIYWDAANNEAIHFGDDRHGSEWQPQVHLYLHNAFGARRKTGLQFTGYSLNGDGSLNDHAKFNITGGTMLHDDFELAIPTSSNSIPVLYSFGNFPRFINNNGYAFAGATRVYYNSGQISLAQADSGNFVLYHIFATNEILTASRKIISVMGTAQYTTLADAYKGVEPELDGIYTYMPQQGRCYLGSIIIQTADEYTNDVKARIVALTGNGSHPPVTIADGSKLYLSINDKQELEIDVDALPGGEGGGEDGREVELSTSGGYVVWRYVGDIYWNNLFLIPADGDDGVPGAPGSDGDDGREVELQENAGWVEWRYVGDASWTQLYEIPGAATDNSVEIYIDFLDTTPFVFTAPYAMKFTTQTAENGAATIDPVLDNNLAQYDDVTITPAAAGLVTLTGVKL